MAFEHCVNHPQSMALWRCGACQKNFCQQCIREDQFSDAVVRLCPQCAGRCEPITLVEQEAPAKPFALQLADAFVYPFRGRGKFVIIAGAIFVWLLMLVRFVLLSDVSMGMWVFGMWLLQGVVYVLAWGYVSAYGVKIIGQTGKGEADPPDVPDIRAWRDDLLQPVCLIAGAIVFSFGLHLLYRFVWTHYKGPTELLRWVTLGLGVLYLPMALTAVAIWDSIGALNPVLIVRSIFKAGIGYLLASAVVALLCAVVWSAFRFLRIEIPYVGFVVQGVLQYAVALYCIMTVMRICGLIYYAYEDRLGWFPD